MDLETWIEKQHLETLEKEFLEAHERAGYILNDKFLEEHEEDYADFLWAKYNDSKTHEKTL